MITTKTALAALVASVSLAPAALAEAPAPKPYTVTTSDLDLRTAAGGRELLGRIDSAANRSCRDWRSIVPRDELSCRRQAVADTVDALKIPALDTAYAEATGGRTVLASSQ
jgi:UrcA family protein